MSTFGSNLRTARDRAKITQNDLANALQVMPQAISQWERDETAPEFARLSRIATALSTTVEELITGVSRYQIEVGEAAFLRGYIGPHGGSHFYQLRAPYLDLVVPARLKADSVLEIRGPGWGEIFDRWLVFYNSGFEPVADKHVGKLCVVRDANGRILLGNVNRGPNNRYALISLHGGATERAEERAEVSQVSCVTQMMPGWAAKVGSV